MVTAHALEIPLPDDVHPTDDERVMLEAVCRLFFSVRGEGRPAWRDTAVRLRNAGWDLHWQLAWCAEARRGDTREQGFGRTLTEALSELEQVAMLDECEGCP